MALFNCIAPFAGDTRALTMSPRDGDPRRRSAADASLPGRVLRQISRLPVTGGRTRARMWLDPSLARPSGELDCAPEEGAVGWACPWPCPAGRNPAPRNDRSGRAASGSPHATSSGGTESSGWTSAWTDGLPRGSPPLPPRRKGNGSWRSEDAARRGFGRGTVQDGATSATTGKVAPARPAPGDTSARDHEARCGQETAAAALRASGTPRGAPAVHVPVDGTLGPPGRTARQLASRGGWTRACSATAERSGATTRRATGAAPAASPWQAASGDSLVKEQKAGPLPLPVVELRVQPGRTA
jgi:hypothetical protein